MKVALLFDFSGTLVRMRPPTLLINNRTLNRLSQEFILGIITGGPRSETLNILRKIGADKYFNPEFVITKNDTILRKPDPKLVELILKRMRVKKCIYLGDTKKDFRLATQSQIPFIYMGKRKLGNIQLRYNYSVVEKGISKLLLSGE